MAGYFISIEGIEGVGKSTVCDFIEKWLEKNKFDYCRTREPGGTKIGEKIRSILLDPKHCNMSAETELLLMFAARAQHLKEVITPALEEKQCVLSDRFTDASFAYQGGGRGIKRETIAMLEQWLHPHLQPDLTILLDAPVDLALKRAYERSAQDRIESEKRTFFEKIRHEYLIRAKQYPDRFIVIDATQRLTVVCQQVEELLTQRIQCHV